MKKIISVVMCLIIAVSLGSSCFADLILDYPDRFTEKHFGEFKILENWHYVSASGSVAQKTPLNPIRAFELYENYPYHVRRTYTDSKGVVWGYIAQDNETNDDIATLGWIPMTSMRPVYGSEDFYGEHEYVFPENIEEKNYVDLSNGAVVYWYPLSGMKKIVNAGVFSEPVRYHFTWEDENGATWTWIFTFDDKKGKTEPYLPGAEAFWVCLDNPLAGYELAPNADTAEVILDPDVPKIEGIAAYGEYEYLDDSVPVPYVPPFGRYLFTALGITLGVTVCTIFALLLTPRSQKEYNEVVRKK